MTPGCAWALTFPSATLHYDQFKLCTFCPSTQFWMEFTGMPVNFAEFSGYWAMLAYSSKRWSMFSASCRPALCFVLTWASDNHFPKTFLHLSSFLRVCIQGKPNKDWHPQPVISFGCGQSLIPIPMTIILQTGQIFFKMLADVADCRRVVRSGSILLFYKN